MPQLYCALYLNVLGSHILAKPCAVDSHIYFCASYAPLHSNPPLLDMPYSEDSFHFAAAKIPWVALHALDVQPLGTQNGIKSWMVTSRPQNRIRVHMDVLLGNVDKRMGFLGTIKHVLAIRDGWVVFWATGKPTSNSPTPVRFYVPLNWSDTTVLGRSWRDIIHYSRFSWSLSLSSENLTNLFCTAQSLNSPPLIVVTRPSLQYDDVLDLDSQYWRSKSA